jgi:hypothetical protein
MAGNRMISVLLRVKALGPVQAILNGGSTPLSLLRQHEMAIIFNFGNCGIVTVSDYVRTQEVYLVLDWSQSVTGYSKTKR